MSYCAARDEDNLLPSYGVQQRLQYAEKEGKHPWGVHQIQSVEPLRVLVAHYRHQFHVERQAAIVLPAT